MSATVGFEGCAELDVQRVIAELPLRLATGHQQLVGGHFAALEMIGEENLWKGHMTHADGSVTVETSFIPVMHYSTARRLQVVDNVFAAEFEDEYFSPASGQAQNVGAADNFQCYSNNNYASGSPAPIAPNGLIVDSYFMSRCSWDTDSDWITKSSPSPSERL